MPAQITLSCLNGFTLYVKDSNLVVSAKRSEETFPISKIQSFVLKEPRALGSGSITFRTAQAATTGINVGFGIGAAIGAEKTFFFTKANLETAQQLRDYVTSYESQQIGSMPDMPAGMVVSVIDEIRGLKGLLDDGIITQMEFEAKKTQLLGL